MPRNAQTKAVSTARVGDAVGRPYRRAAESGPQGSEGWGRMNKRPNSITVVSWLFIAAGGVGLTYHASKFKVQPPLDYELLWICVVRLLAILCGVFMLRGRNWARWGAVVWLGYHVILSSLHTPYQLLMHSLLFAAVLYFLCRPRASAYFRGTTRDGAESKSMVR